MDNNGIVQQSWVRRNPKKSVVSLLILFLFVFFEIVLRIFPNPFLDRVKGDKIILPVNKDYSFENNKFKKLDKTVIHKKNSLGFRGEEPPVDFKNHLTIITVGGSTTECAYLSDGKTWPDVLGMELKKVFRKLWINNAGFSGHSTFGHKVLMEDFIIKLKPKIVLFLVGINDPGIEAYAVHEVWAIKGVNFYSLRRFIISLGSHSEVLASALNIYRNFRAMMNGLWNIKPEIDLKEFKEIEVSEEAKTSIKQKHKERYLAPYKTRLLKLIQISKENGIEPVLVTQPALWGNVIDDITNVNLAKIKLEKSLEESNISGELAWEILELYNDCTRQTGREENLLVIDLAKKMPKSSRYYYDFSHYINEGAEKVAEIIYKDLSPFLAKKYYNYSKLLKNQEDQEQKI